MVLSRHSPDMNEENHEYFRIAHLHTRIQTCKHLNMEQE